MTAGIFEVIGVLMVIATAAFLAVIAWDFRDDLASMHERLNRRDARRAARQTVPIRAGKPVPKRSDRAA